jgi:hypothetical protein
MLEHEMNDRLEAGKRERDALRAQLAEAEAREEAAYKRGWSVAQTYQKIPPADFSRIRERDWLAYRAGGGGE